MLPNAKTMLDNIPGGLHVEALDENGIAHDGVVVAFADVPELSDYGITRHGEGDSLFVALPFALPRGRITIRRGGVESVRRIISSTDHAIFLNIRLGE